MYSLKRESARPCVTGGRVLSLSGG
jgi:hypothetical protein